MMLISSVYLIKQNKNMSVRTRQSGDLGVVNVDDLLHRLQEVINSKTVI
jgi:threonyl-tRNA synthetase